MNPLEIEKDQLIYDTAIHSQTIFTNSNHTYTTNKYSSSIDLIKIGLYNLYEELLNPDFALTVRAYLLQLRHQDNPS